LDVYSDQDKERLKLQVQGINWKIFISNDYANTFTKEDESIVFTDEKEDEYIKLMEIDITGSNAKKINMLNTATDAYEDEVNIDDI
jgi:hypothetical protein